MGGMKKTLYLLTGCTATGKTGLALHWAERFGAEIVSCDAMLFYRGMDIGTAKPTVAERARAPHHLIDVSPVDEAFDVGHYASRARRAVEDIEARGRRPLVVGGSGFYLMSYLRPVVDAVRVDRGTRERVESLWQREGLAGLRAALERCNPGGLGGLDTANARRVARALERCWASGRPLDELEADFRRQPAPFPEYAKRVCVVERGDDDLKRRIAARAEKMVAAGLVEEVRALRGRGLEKNPAARRAIGYRETLEWIAEGKRGSLAELAQRIAGNTWKLVKKQKTWFRRQLPEAGRIFLTDENEGDVDDLFLPE